MLDKALAVFAIATLIVFVGILIWFVKSPSLIIVVVLGIGFASLDFYNTAFRKKNGKP